MTDSAGLGIEAGRMPRQAIGFAASYRSLSLEEVLLSREGLPDTNSLL